MSKRWLTLALCALGAFSACTGGPDPNLTETGAGRPQVSASMPDSAEAGSVVTVQVQITNPGPKDMSSVVVAFARVGDPSLPPPIVEPRASRSEGGIEAIRPEPASESPEDSVFIFGALPEGESTSIEFDLRIPDEEGPVGNSIQVYDGREIERARGVRIETNAT